MLQSQLTNTRLVEIHPQKTIKTKQKQISDDRSYHIMHGN